MGLSRLLEFNKGAKKMNICDYCKQEIEEHKVVHLRFDWKWTKEFGRSQQEFCSLECLRKWLDEK